jgi:DNA recombination-dependent growth factor C
MSLENGTASFRLFWVPEGGEEEAVIGRLAHEALPELGGGAGRAPVEGWCGPRHAFDRDLTPENISASGWLRFRHVRAEAKVPASLLEAECAVMEQAEREARGAGRLPGGVRAEIRDRAERGLLAKAQHTLSGIGVWARCGTGELLAEAATDAKIDRIAPALRRVFGTVPVCATPEAAALKLGHGDARNLAPCGYTPDETRGAPDYTELGMEFLTWLFWRFDKTGGVFRTRTHGPEYGYMPTGSLTFWHMGQGAFEVDIRKGSPVNSREAIACLLDGKLLSRARFTVCRGDLEWSAVIDHTFLFSGLNLPKMGKDLDPYEVTALRLQLTGEFVDAWLALYSQFLGERCAATWPQQAAAIRQWVAERAGLALHTPKTQQRKEA